MVSWGRSSTQTVCVQENWCSQLQATADTGGNSAGRLWSKKGLPGPERLGHGPPPPSLLPTSASFSKANSWLDLLKNCIIALFTLGVSNVGKRRSVTWCQRLGGSCTLPLSLSPSSPTLPPSSHPPSFVSFIHSLLNRLLVYTRGLMQLMSSCSSMVKDPTFFELTVSSVISLKPSFPIQRSWFSVSATVSGCHCLCQSILKSSVFVLKEFHPSCIFQRDLEIIH